ncbi:von Willebrand factor type A domain-containing protein [Planctomycetota bacterium]
MKTNENNFEKNISRLVKLTGDSDKPAKAFSDSVIEDALNQLNQPTDQKRDRKDRIMKLNWKRTLSWAAVIMLVCAVGAGLLIPNLNQTVPGPAPTGKKQIPTKKIAKRDARIDQPAKLEYTEIDADGSAVAVAKPKTTPPPVAQPMNKIVAMDMKNNSPVQALNDTLAYARKKERATDIRLGKQLMAVGSESAKRATLGVSGSRVSCIMPPATPAEPGGSYPMAHGGMVPPNGEDVDAMFFKNYGVNPFVDTEDDHLSTFATDVDTGSYTVVRGYLHDGHLPPEKAVRVEEFVNYFKYDYAAPQEDDFAVYAEGSPWTFGTGRKNTYLLRLGLKGKQISDENRKPAILTFVIDVSGSMNRENRLGLVKKSLRMLVDNLKKDDQIAIAVYGSRGRIITKHKSLDQKNEILIAIDSLGAGGSTFAEEGIRLGYEMAEKAFKKGCINRVILCSDGVANVGQTGAEAILEIIKSKADKGVTLSALGFGMGNYNDVLMEQLGDKGNGYYAYIDTIAQAKRLFEENLTGSLQVIARDVKVQVDFNPKVVRSYRLIGYENRDVPDDKFRDDKYDGGEMGAGHATTALYELKLWPEKKGTVATTYVRYKDPDSFAVTEFKSSIAVKDFNADFDSSGANFRLAATVAEFAEILRKSYWAKGAKLTDTLARAQQLAGEKSGDADIIELVDLIAKANQQTKNKVDEPVEIDVVEELQEK